MTTGVGVTDDIRRHRALAGEKSISFFRGSQYIYAYDSNRVKYICRNMVVGAGLSDSGWLIWKYSDEDLPRSEGPLAANLGISSVSLVDDLSWSF